MREKFSRKAWIGCRVLGFVKADKRMGFWKSVEHFLISLAFSRADHGLRQLRRKQQYISAVALHCLCIGYRCPHVCAVAFTVASSVLQEHYIALSPPII